MWRSNKAKGEGKRTVYFREKGCSMKISGIIVIVTEFM